VRVPRRFAQVFPPPSELAWYAAIRILRHWAARLPEGEMVRRSVRLAGSIAVLAGKSPAAFTAMGRGIAQTVFYRTHAMDVLSRLDGPSSRRWEGFRAEAAASPRSIFVSAHLGPFQLQMDLLADLLCPILILYRAYTWPPLAVEMAELRKKTDRFTYVDIRRPREIVKALRNGMSLGILGDVAPSPVPARLAVRWGAPIFVGGLYNLGDPQETPPPGSAPPAPQVPASLTPAVFGFEYHRIDPSDEETTARACALALDRTLRAHRSDWIHS